MAVSGEAPTTRVGKVLGIAIVVSLITGAIAGFAAGFLSKAPGQAPAQAPQERDFWVFTVVLPFNDTPATPHDYFAPDRMTVNQGDTVTIHFFNTETEPEDHTFTMAAPYEMNHVVPYNSTVSFNFPASTPGIFAYRCVYHQPTMTGWLVVLQP